MAKLLGIISLILAIVLFPPAALAVISNNAVPGDGTYPIKRGLEDVIYAVASLTPTTKAWFAAARSDRRFQEVAALITQGKQAGDTLNELVEQTQIAASQIAQVSDLAQRTKLIEQLSGSIEKYDKGLKQIASEMPQTTIQPQVTTLPSSSAVPSSSPTVQPIIVHPTQPTTSPTVRPIVQPTTQPTPTPLPTVEPTPRPNRQEEDKEKQRQREIEEARKRLEEIRKRLEEESSRHQINQTQSRKEKSGKSENRDNEQNSDNKKGDKSDKKEEKSESRKDNKRKD